EVRELLSVRSLVRQDPVNPVRNSVAQQPPAQGDDRRAARQFNHRKLSEGGHSRPSASAACPSPLFLKRYPVRIERLGYQRAQSVTSVDGGVDVCEMRFRVDTDLCPSNQTRIDRVVVRKQPEPKADVVLDRKAGYLRECSGQVIRVPTSVQKS